MRIGTGLAAAVLLAAAAAPADAGGRHRRHHHNDIDADDLIAGAVVVGGLAAIASAIGEGNRAKQDAAVDACAAEAESRTGGRVADIVRVGKRRGYFTVEGELDGAEAGRFFTCTVRRGTIYRFQTGGGGA
jgi:hypothetical protein